jgi:hypothetical protein
MTPTLFGRWQMRLFLLPTVGLLVSSPFALGLFSPKSLSYLYLLLYMGICGALSDVVAQQIQKLRWDSDWPGLLQFVGALGEGVLLAVLLKVNQLPGINTNVLPMQWLLLQYAIASVAMFLATHSLLRILFPHSRYRGGQWF